MSVFLLTLVGHEVFVHEQALTWIDFWILLAALAAAFGKSIFTSFLSRVSLASSSSDTTAKAESKAVTIHQEIQARRSAGIEHDAEATQ
jgi:hypothetical protein